MKNQTIFKRYEIKYLITKKQKEIIKATMAQYMKGDSYGRNTIFNIYLDTPDSLIIRRSMDKPIYKEKLRVRSYGKADMDSVVFVELKKKFEDVVYKRRVAMKCRDAFEYLCNGKRPSVSNQITNETDYFCKLYKDIKPMVFLSYEREAFYGKDDHDFRVTFDENILWRDSDLSLCAEKYGSPLISDDMSLMEIKTAGSMPLWMAHVLTENKIYKTSFSKYGNAYRQSLMNMKSKGVYKYA